MSPLNGAEAQVFDDSNCGPDCRALCEHFEQWYRDGMNAAWRRVGDGLRGVRDSLDRIASDRAR